MKYVSHLFTRDDFLRCRTRRRHHIYYVYYFARNISRRSIKIGCSFIRLFALGYPRASSRYIGGYTREIFKIVVDTNFTREIRMRGKSYNRKVIRSNFFRFFLSLSISLFLSISRKRERGCVHCSKTLRPKRESSYPSMRGVAKYLPLCNFMTFDIRNTRLVRARNTRILIFQPTAKPRLKTD